MWHLNDDLKGLSHADIWGNSFPETLQTQRPWGMGMFDLLEKAQKISAALTSAMPVL